MIEQKMSAPGLAEMDWHIAARLHLYNLRPKTIQVPCAASPHIRQQG
jgi:hypothetical protein